MTLAEDASIALETICGALPGGGERRPGQDSMTRLVADAITYQKHAVVRAGTGTGKSLAYLIPAILADQPVIVATATKALQDQLANKDLPFLQENLGHSFSFAVLKGRANYVCRQKLNELERANQQQTLGSLAEGLPDHADPKHLTAIAEWADETETGDRAELSFEPRAATWGAVSVGSNECPGRIRCPAGEECFAEKARDDAALADIVITNLYLYAIDIAIENSFLPEHQVAILDEAHKTEEVFSTSLGFEIHAGRFRSLHRTASGVLTACPELDQTEELAGLIEDALAPSNGNRVVPAELPPLARALELADTRLGALDAVLRKIQDKTEKNSLKGIETASKITRTRQALGSLLESVQAARSLDNNKVAWVDRLNGRMVLEVALITVDHILKESLWPERTVILTSATVPANLAQRLGLETDDFEYADVGSPFNFENQSLLYCAAHLPDPRHPDYRQALHDEIEHLIVAAGGRTLALFPSRKALNEATEYLRPRLPWHIYHQDDLPKPALMAAFAEDEQSCLFGTKGLWHGIDVPGRTCSLVIIDKIPFPSPRDPLLSARRERVGDNSFRKIDLPLAATELAQGVGRLIRSGTDLGVAAVLDSRLAKNKGYRYDLLDALPPMERSADSEIARNYLQRITEN